MKRRILVRTAAAAVLLAAGGFLFAWSGLFNIGASTGHWPVTAWFLHFAMRNSVQTHALQVADPPPLDDPALILRGAGHYAQGCAPCHGEPGAPTNPVVREMTPHPPDLATRIGRWQPEELFWIVMNGVKFTGMPAWPAPQRDDEGWAVTAFLLQLPELSPAAYRRLAEGAGDNGRESETAGTPTADDPQRGRKDAGLVALTDPPEPILATCARCHGNDGRGRGDGAFPVLSGQNPAYLAASLKSYAAGERHSGIMQLAAAGLGEEAIAALARHYAGSQPGSLWRSPKRQARQDALPGDDPALHERGAAIARDGVPAAGIPPCASCHGPASTPRHPLYPVLAGQHRGYLTLQLTLFKEGARGGTPFAHIMTAVASRMTVPQIEAVSRYYATLAADAPAPSSNPRRAP